MPRSLVAKLPLPLRWHLRRFQSDAFGASGLLCIGLTAAGIAWPWDRVLDGTSWADAAGRVVLLGALLLTFLVMAKVSESDGVELWLFHRGQSPAQWALERFIANLGLIAAVAVLWMLVALATAAQRGIDASLLDFATIAGAVVGIAVVLGSLFFLLGSTGTRHADGFVLLSVVVAIYAPLLAKRLPAPLATALDLAAPPLLEVAALRSALRQLDWPAVLDHALRCGTWTFAVLGLGGLLLSRRVPRS